MDQSEFEALMAKAPQAPAQAAPEAPAADTQAAPNANSELTASIPPGIREGLQAVVDGLQNDPMRSAPGNIAAPGTPAVLEGTMTGAAKGLFETKDFLFGETPPEDRSAFRTTIEARDKQLDDSSMVTGFASGVGQFAISMIGLGKAQRVAEALPWFGKGLGAVLAAAPKTVESVKAAIAGATAFDPHEERLSNLIQDTPLANPVNAWLAADPSDSAAEGRVKSALESIGLDATIVGVFMGSTRIWKALRQGDTAAASRAVDELEADQKAAVSEGEVQAVGPTAPAKPQSEPTGSAGSYRGMSAEEVPPIPIDATAPELTGKPGDSRTASDPATVPRIRFSDENTTGLLQSMTADADAITKAGGWYQAIEAGHTFGRGEGIPYGKLAMDRDIDDFMARVVDASEERLDALKGGSTLPDETVEKTVEQMATLFNTDASRLLGMIRQAGDDATNMVANMEAGYLVSSRMLQDAHALASRIRLGDYVQFGSRDAAMEALKHHLSVASSIYGAARSMTAAGMAKPHVRHLQGDRYAVQQDDLVAPVELVGVARREEQRHVGLGRRRSSRLRPAPGISAHGVVAALIAERAQFLIDPDQRQLLTRRLAEIAVQEPVELVLPRSDLRLRLSLSLIGERCLVGPEDLADRVARHVQLAADPLERPPLHMKGTPNPGDRIHCLHPLSTRSPKRTDGRRSTS